MGEDEQVLHYVTSANVACGFHAGDYNVMHKTVKIAAEKGVAIGAHPGLPDLAGFGRRYMEVSSDDVYNMIVYQINALKGFTHLYGTKLHHVKPHGALYNMAAKDPIIAEAIVNALKSTDESLILYGLANSELVKTGKAAGLTVAEEVFADRTYEADGTLTPRNQEHAVIHDPKKAKEQALQMAKMNTVTAVDGTEIPIQADTLCVHGDGAQALSFVKELRQLFMNEEIRLETIGERR
ncbi:LamB/YcsF family protein [Evansella halocellulosilytica]|uniref:LamB/YcsF family protein n=1 Tax=Evansella halocellulosilytica TaxID=2011013 RepID=UPI00211BA0B9|nr:5-oxoprolinase subunit PxpA [Evansella halocellulosilytica]